VSQTSKAPKPARATPAPRTNPLPAIISALVVIGVFVALGFMLYNTRPGAATQNASYAPTAGAAAATTAPATPAPATAAPAVAATAPAAQAQPAGAKKTYSAPPPMTIDPTKSYTATITTPRGDIVIKLRPDIAPQTVNNFVFLAREGFYNGLTWHRVIQGFMAQGGDPQGTGMGGPGYTIPAEFTNKILFDRPGIVAMARSSDPNSAGSQFFITTAPAPHLNEQYTIFGEVIKGQDIVDGIPLRDPDTATTPGEPIVKITIAEK
jgi:peptidylprolyl isomerase